MPTPQECAQLLLETIPALMRGLHGSMRHMKRADEEPLTMGQLRMMEMLRCQPFTLSELAARHHVTPSTMSRTIDVLVRKAWVARQSDPSDRRQVILTLTDEGKAAHTAMIGQTREAVARLMAQLDDHERAKLYDGLSVLQRLLTRPMPADRGSQNTD